MGVFYQEPDHTVYCGHALTELGAIPDGSVDMAITSPPYWGLRTYKTEPIIWGENHCEHEWEEHLEPSRGRKHPNPSIVGANRYVEEQGMEGWAGKPYKSNFCLKCHAWKGELGLEPTIELYIEHLISIFREVKRVLKKTGTCWVNIDDSYCGATSQHRGNESQGHNSCIARGTYGAVPDNGRKERTLNLLSGGIPAKSLCLIPQRFAIAMVNAGWILRNDIAWNKPNPMPESVKDRFTGSWEHLFFFAKNKRYFFDQQFEPVAESTIGRGLVDFGGAKGRNYRPAADDPNYRHGSEQWGRTFDYTQSCALGRNKRDVWEIATEPYPEAHFATFPEKLCEIPILAGCPSMICKKCGKARGKIIDMERPDDYDPSCIDEGYQDNCRKASGAQGTNRPISQIFKDSLRSRRVESGYTDCGCNVGFEPGVVLDPFCGSGKALAVAKRLGRKSIGIDLNPGYCKLAARALQAVPLAMPLLAT